MHSCFICSTEQTIKRQFTACFLFISTNVSFLLLPSSLFLIWERLIRWIRITAFYEYCAAGQLSATQSTLLQLFSKCVNVLPFSLWTRNWIQFNSSSDWRMWVSSWHFYLSLPRTKAHRHFLKNSSFVTVQSKTPFFLFSYSFPMKEEQVTQPSESTAFDTGLSYFPNVLSDFS